MKSEVAQLKERIDLECRASWWALKGMASGIAQHQFISARLKKMDEYHGRLALLIGEEAATAYSCEVFEPEEGEQ